jgi:hypothetical protein
MKIIGLTGRAGAGKDTAAQALTDLGWERIAFADPIREALVALDPCIEINTNGKVSNLSTYVELNGWDHAKKLPEVRQLLQRMGTEAGRDIHGDMCWLTIAAKKVFIAVRNAVPGIVFTDMRFANEWRFISSLQGKTVRIFNSRTENDAVTHLSEAHGSVPVDFTINNNGTIDELKTAMLAIVEGIR